MKFTSKLTVAPLSLLIALMLLCGSASAQSLTTREKTDAKAKAKITRALVSARSQAAKEGNARLVRDRVNLDCKPVQIGAQDDDKPERGRSARKEEPVVVTGDVINICR